MPRSISQTIIDRVVEEMIQNAQEMGDIVIVPNTYDIYIHTDDFKDVRAFLNPLREQIIQRLDFEIKKRSSRKLKSEGAISMLNKLLGSDVFAKGKEYRRVDDGWHLNFEECAGKIHLDDRVFVLRRGEIAVVRGFLFPDDRTRSSEYRTLVTIYDRSASAKTTLLKRMVPNPQTSTPSESTSCLATLQYRYPGDGNVHTFRMVKDQIIIGRGAADVSVDLRLTNASERVSPAHLEIRRDKGSGVFVAKNLGGYGATLNGKDIPGASASQTPTFREPPVLKNGSRISLAGGEVVIDFFIEEK